MRNKRSERGILQIPIAVFTAALIFIGGMALFESDTGLSKITAPDFTSEDNYDDYSYQEGDLSDLDSNDSVFEIAYDEDKDELFTEGEYELSYNNTSEYEEEDDLSVLGEIDLDIEEKSDDYYGPGSYSQSQLKYNAFSNRWEYAGEDAELKYNAFENRWQYAPEDASVRYNVFDDRWQYARDEDSLQYNAFENKWDYGSDNSSLDYNSFENRWERTEPGESLQYNAFENTWSYE